MKLLILITLAILIFISTLVFLLKFIGFSSELQISKRGVALNSTIMVIGILLVGSASFFSEYYVKNNYRYTDITLAPADIKTEMDVIKTTYLVLYRDDCRDCIRAESQLTHAIRYAEHQGKSVFLLNVNKMNSIQGESFKKEYKEILYDGKIATPTVAKLEGTGKTWKVVEFDNTGDIEKQVKILNGK